MLQLQLALFPEGITAITAEVGCECRQGVVTYFYGHLPLFQHEATDRPSFRIFTSQMIVNGTVRVADMVGTFGVPRITVRRWVEKLRQEGVGSFFVDRRHGSARVVTGEVREQAQQFLEQGVGVPEIAGRLQVKANTLNTAIRQGRLGRPEQPAEAIATYVDQESWQLEEIQAGLKELDTGQSVSHEKVSRWLRSWGRRGAQKAPRG